MAIDINRLHLAEVVAAEVYHVGRFVLSNLRAFENLSQRFLLVRAFNWVCMRIWVAHAHLHVVPGIVHA